MQENEEEEAPIVALQLQELANDLHENKRKTHQNYICETTGTGSLHSAKKTLPTREDD